MVICHCLLEHTSQRDKSVILREKTQGDTPCGSCSRRCSGLGLRSSLYSSAQSPGLTWPCLLVKVKCFSHLGHFLSVPSLIEKSNSKGRFFLAIRNHMNSNSRKQLFHSQDKHLKPTSTPSASPCHHQGQSSPVLLPGLGIDRSPDLPWNKDGPPGAVSVIQILDHKAQQLHAASMTVLCWVFPTCPALGKCCTPLIPPFSLHSNSGVYTLISPILQMKVEALRGYGIFPKCAQQGSPR